MFGFLYLKKMKKSSKFYWTKRDMLRYTPLWINIADIIYHLLLRVLLGLILCALFVYATASVYGEYSEKALYWSERKRNAIMLLPQCSNLTSRNDDHLLNCPDIRKFSQISPSIQAITSTSEWVASKIGGWIPTIWCEQGTSCRFMVQSFTNNIIQWAGFIVFGVMLICILYIIWGICSTRHAIARTRDTYKNMSYVKPYHLRHPVSESLKLIEIDDDDEVTYDEEQARQRITIKTP